MTHTTEQLISNLTNDLGRISWDDACVLAKGHGLLDDLIEDFGNLENYGRGLNAELLAHWLGYDLPEAD